MQYKYVNFLTNPKGRENGQGNGKQWIQLITYAGLIFLTN